MLVKSNEEILRDEYLERLQEDIVNGIEEAMKEKEENGMQEKFEISYKGRELNLLYEGVISDEMIKTMNVVEVVRLNVKYVDNLAMSKDEFYKVLIYFINNNIDVTEDMFLDVSGFFIKRVPVVPVNSVYYYIDEENAKELKRAEIERSVLSKSSEVFYEL